MKSLAIAIAEHDPAAAHEMKTSLDRCVRSVCLVQSLAELKSAIARHRVDAIIANLETVALDEVAEISRKLRVPVICTHRVPDDEMWMAALDAGAIDVCASADARAIASSLQRHVSYARQTAA